MADAGNGRCACPHVTVAEVRPGAAALLRVLPPLAEPHVEVTYEQVRGRLSRRHWTAAAVASVGFLATTVLALHSPLLHASPAVLLWQAIDGPDPGPAARIVVPAALTATLIGMARATRTQPRGRRPGWWRPSTIVRRLFDFAAHEEYVWRAGCDRWPRRTRVAACVTAGALQLLAFVVPLSVALFTAGLNGLFTCWYRRAARRDRGTAMVDTVALHWAYYLTVPAVMAAAAPVALAVVVF